MKSIKDVIESVAFAIATNVVSDIITDEIKRRRDKKASDPEAGEKDKGKEAK